MIPKNMLGKEREVSTLCKNYRQLRVETWMFHRKEHDSAKLSALEIYIHLTLYGLSRLYSGIHMYRHICMQ